MGKHNWKNLPLVSAGLVIVNCLVFLVCQLTGDRLTTMGMLSPWSVFVDGEVWRVFTAMFLHGNVQHIFSNMLILFFLGSMLEKEIGHLPLFIIYLLSGIGGNAASLYEKYARGSLVASLGASGAVFGLDGLLLALVLFSPKRWETAPVPRVIAMILLSLYSGYTAGHIDNAAHVGGLSTGFLAGIVWCQVFEKRRRRKNLEY